MPRVGNLHCCLYSRRVRPATVSQKHNLLCERFCSPSLGTGPAEGYCLQVSYPSRKHHRIPCWDRTPVLGLISTHESQILDFPACEVQASFCLFFAGRLFGPRALDTSAGPGRRHGGRRRRSARPRRRGRSGGAGEPRCLGLLVLSRE